MVPLTAFEEFLFWEDRPDYPCWIIIRFSFQGIFDEESLNKAYATACKRHPLLCSVVRKRMRGLFWEFLENYEPKILWYDGQLEEGWPSFPPLDLTQTPGWRTIVFKEEEMTTVFFQLHHAVCDGKSMQRVISEIMLCYLTEVKNKDGSHDAVIEEKKERVRPNRKSPPHQTFSARLLGAAISLRMQFRHIAPLAGKTKSKINERRPSYPTVFCGRLDKTELEKINESAQKLSVTLNDYLICSFQSALGCWRDQQQIGAPNDWIRILVPVSLHESSRVNSTARNQTSIVCFDCRAKELKDRPERLEQLQQEMAWIKYGGLKYSFLNMLACFRLIPGSIRFLSTQSSFFRATAVVSNISKNSFLFRPDALLTVDGVTLEEVTLTGPLRSGVPLFLIVMMYGGKLLLDLNYDSTMLSEIQVEALMKIFLAELKI
jgi:NRPS condensation-like uncharacterized protein